jgi:hypothetical protein
VSNIVMFPNAEADLLAMNVGDKFYSEGLFQGVSNKKLKFMVYGVNGKKRTVRATYFGIAIGSYELSFSKGKVKLNAVKE